jgi:predicted metal-dependent hydrolase
MIYNNQELKDRVRYGTKNIDYYIKKSKRIKTSELIVDFDKIEVRTPSNKTIEDTREIIRDKAEWILRKQKELKKSISEIVKPTYDRNSTLPYLGKNCHLKINTNQLINALTFANGIFIVDITSSRVDDVAKIMIKHLYDNWAIEMAYPLLKAKVEKFSEKLSVDAPKIFLKKNLKSRWASLTKKGSIHFNMNLIKAPQDIIDYIVLHEVCHLRIKGHSHHYWDFVHRFMPDYEDKINWLTVNGKVLIDDGRVG